MAIDNSFVTTSRAEAQATAKLAREAAGAGSWLMAMAIILGKVADNMQGKIIDKATQLDQPGSKKSENRLTAELQAQTQLMNMFMQAMSSAIKSVGEANAQVARKTG